MARGFLSGAIWGTVIAVGGLGAVSVLVPSPDAVSPQGSQEAVEPLPTAIPEAIEDANEPAAAMDAEVMPAVPEPAPIDPEASESDVSAALVSTDDTPETPAPVTETTEPVTEPESEQQPVPEAAGTAVTTPEVQTAEDTATPGRKPADVMPVQPDAAAPELDSPATVEDTVPEETAAAPVPTPDTGDAIAALGAPDAGTASMAPLAPGTDLAPDSAAAPTLDVPQIETGPNVSTEPAQPPAPAVPAIETPLVPEPEAAEEAEVPTAASEGESSADANAETDDQATASERPPVRRLLPSAPETAPDTGGTTTAPSRPAIGTPAASLTDRNPGNSARLPSIGCGADTAIAEESALNVNVSGLPPLQRFAAPVDSDPDLPKMSIVMIDDGTGPLGPDTLEGFPFPVTFAIDPAIPGAAARMASYRASGYEVAALVNLPVAAQPTDVEQILGGAVAAVPEAVALIEAPGGGLQAERSVTEQASRFAADSGHGLVFLPNGLNTAQAIAQREAVPAISILRDFDGDGQDARTKRRFLDGGAFRARQDGAVVMLGRLTPDTLSALVLWSLQDRASSVAMVPISTLLLDTSN